MKADIREYETELDWFGVKTVSAVVHYDYSPQHRGGRNEPDGLDSVTILAVRAAKKFGNAVFWHDILQALPVEVVEHFQLRALDDIRANRADEEYEEQLDRCIGM